MYKILLVDDKEIFCRHIKRMNFFRNNSDFGIYRTANSAEQALEFLHNEEIDITITDIRMPVMNGIELLKEINTNKLCRCTLLMSEYTDFTYAKEGILNGAFDYLVKPIDENMLLNSFQRINDYLRKTEPSVKENNAFMQLIPLISSKDSDGFEKVLSEISSKFYATDTQGRQRYHQIHISLLKISDMIYSEYSYMPLFMPVTELCTVSDYSDHIEMAFNHFVRSTSFIHSWYKNFIPESQNTLIKNVWLYIINNIDHTYNLNFLSNHFFVNKSYLSKLFHKETNICYKSLVTKYKIERARYLLSCTKLKIYEISEQLGFSDAEHFRKVFKSADGSSPSRFDYNRYMDLHIHFLKQPNNSQKPPF